MSFVEQELLILPEPPSSSVFSGERVAQALCFCVLYCRLLLVPFPLAPLHCQSFSDLRLLVDPLVSVNGSFSQQCDLFIHRTSNTINRNHNTIRRKSWSQYRTATKKPGVNRLMESHCFLVIYIFGVHSRYTHVYGNCVCVQLIFNVLLHSYMSVTRFWLKKKKWKKNKVWSIVHCCMQKFHKYHEHVFL